MKKIEDIKLNETPQRMVMYTDYKLGKVYNIRLNNLLGFSPSQASYRSAVYLNFPGKILQEYPEIDVKLNEQCVFSFPFVTFHKALDRAYCREYQKPLESLDVNKVYPVHLALKRISKSLLEFVTFKIIDNQ